MDASSTESDSDISLSPVDSILEAILCGMERSQFDRTPVQFLPEDAIEGIFARDRNGAHETCDPQHRVLEILGGDPANDEDIKLANFTLNRAKRVFLICLLDIRLENLRQAMVIFLNQNFDDGCLPIDCVSYDDLYKPKSKHLFQDMETRERQRQGRKHKRVWKPSSIAAFAENQWKFLAPVFGTTSLIHDFGQRTLPFVRDKSRYTEGTFGSVSRFRIHGAHFVDPKQQKLPFGYIIAVKQFKKEREDVTIQWENEVRALAQMNDLGHDRVVRFITAFRHGQHPDVGHYICFEWADGSNLEDLWNENPHPRLSASLIRAVVDQLHGLAQALCATHYLPNRDGEEVKESFIHGDMKPKNILWFKEGGELGTLKIGDWGEAKVYGHNTATRHNTTGKYGTRRYEPPEVEVGVRLGGGDRIRGVRSRLYDTWSFGCFTLEFIIWILHGKEGLDRFRQDDVSDYGMSDSFYEVNHERKAKVHGVVRYWMDYLAKDPLCCFSKSALGDLLDLVQHGLLVVKLPGEGASLNARVKTYSRFIRQSPTTPEETSPNGTTHRVETMALSGSDTTPAVNISDLYDVKDDTGDVRHSNEGGNIPVERPIDLERFRAIELRDNLEYVARTHDSDGYWFKDLPRRPLPPKFREQARLLFSDIPSRLRGNYDYARLDPEDWKIGLDNEFATRFFERFNNMTSLSACPSVASEHLCESCHKFRQEIWSPFFSIAYSTEQLSQNTEAQSCDLCALLWGVCAGNANTSISHSRVQFERRGSTVRMSDRRYPVLSLFRDHDTNSTALDIQTGFSELPAIGHEDHFNVVRSWLEHCDDNHRKEPRCKPSRFKKSAAGSIAKYPTRLIAVGGEHDTTVRLQEMQGQEGGNWIALSYQWGPPPHFQTTSQNLSAHHESIDIRTLPQTFQDAISVTRALKQPYLWVDSLCIIQGLDGDFDVESKTMEDIYNGAYCVLAACCATDQNSGFLLPREPRQYVTLDTQHQSYGAIHVCQMIDRFDEHVLGGDLNKRGWVLQEHALARRTIFFTKFQTYWECGHGIRCETMANLKNEHAALLGDPNFPKRLESAEHGEFIIRLQDLLKQYSRLDLSRDYDRSTAIVSLQQRLLRVMAVQGDYGAFDDPENPGLLRRSLLWHRSLDVECLTLINFRPLDELPKEEPPSWSWMAYSGPIDYFPLKFWGFDWQPLETSWSNTDKTSLHTGLKTKVQRLDISRAEPFEATIIFDIPKEVNEDDLMATVLGIEKGTQEVGNRRHYVLLVTSKHVWNHSFYGRIGAGYVPGRCLIGTPEDCSLV